MKFVPILNAQSHSHLTQEDWESLAFSHVAIDVIQLFLHGHVFIPETGKTVFLITTVLPCHKTSRLKDSPGDFFLHSPHNGEKIPVTQESIQNKLVSFKEKQGAEKKIIIINSLSTEYDISDQPGKDAEQGALYSNNGVISIKNLEWATVIAPIKESCDCYTCQHFTLSYLHHLNQVGVPLGVRLGLLHNLYQRR